MVALNKSEAANTAADKAKKLRERLAELAEKHAHEVTHGDVVSRNDVLDEMKQVQRELNALSGAVETPSNDAAFFSRTSKAPDKFADSRAVVEEARKKGAILDPGTARPLKKEGTPVSAEGKLRTLWMDITPAVARLWLDNNFRNRPLGEEVVAAYARDMQNGVWVPTHQGIAFNDRDELIDGQHRLHAIVLSGCTVRMMVTFGLASDIEGREMTTMDAVDRGRTRSVADQLKIQHGLKDGSAIAMICASLAGLCFQARTRRLSVGQTLEIFRAFEEPVKWVIAHRSKQPGFKNAGVLAAFAFAMALPQPDSDHYAWMASRFDSLSSGEGLGQDSALAHLRAFLASDDAKLLNRTTDRGLAELVLQAIFLELQGKRIEKLEMSLDGVTHFRTQQKERVKKIAAMFALPKGDGK